MHVKGDKVAAGQLPPWDVAELPRPPRLSWSPRALVGPGLMMAGAAIGGGEWLMGPAVTARYGGIVMWIAMASILFQVIYNLEIMRYTAYCGEPIIVGFFRVRPGPKFWTIAYLMVDFFGLWPYLASNAAVPVTAAILGHLPGTPPAEYSSIEELVERTGLPHDVVLELKEHPERFGSVEQGKQPFPAEIVRIMGDENRLKQWITYAVFALSFLPLIFGGKIYTSLERLMVAKIILVLGYLLFLGLFYVDGATWGEVFAGFLFCGKGADGTWSFRLFPDIPPGEAIDWSLLAAFAAIAGQGGMTNSQTSTYVRDKGWGMGSQVGAIPSMVGGTGITLSHTGKVFPINAESLQRWRGWMRLFQRDQWVIWAVGCILGVAIPALVSLQFVRGKNLTGDAIAAATASGIVQATGNPFFWYATLLCGFIVLLPSQITQSDGVIRRWTDLLWTGNERLQRWEGHAVKYVYYGLLCAYATWGFIILVLFPSALTVLKFTTTMMNLALGFSSFHTLAVNSRLLPRELQAHPLQRLALCLCGVFFCWISVMSLHSTLVDLKWIQRLW